ncbi:hypothetical protein ElyMa_000170500 [Elysia marginata]|uniref:FCP1 homology domain-containing protein n=1 Tax=Elysia marginata TaxID=1093978 RepID=A0AAV4EV74_9GAST|nr:hypothetical protein ElyMa_000170500 [Elysia marginata]
MASGTTKPPKPTKQQRGKVDSFASALTKKGIRLLAVDFDKTLIDIHSRGMWDEGVNKLAAHVRPCMRDLLEDAHHKGVFVAIVTYHRQDWLLKDVLGKVLPKNQHMFHYLLGNVAFGMYTQAFIELGASPKLDTGKPRMLLVCTPKLYGSTVLIANSNSKAGLASVLLVCMHP